MQLAHSCAWYVYLGVISLSSRKDLKFIPITVLI
jgi:hypothetical protein